MQHCFGCLRYICSPFLFSKPCRICIQWSMPRQDEQVANFALRRSAKASLGLESRCQLMTQLSRVSNPCCQIQVERGDFLGTGIGWFHFPCFWNQGPQFKVSRFFVLPLIMLVVIPFYTGFGQTSKVFRSSG